MSSKQFSQQLHLYAVFFMTIITFVMSQLNNYEPSQYSTMEKSELFTRILLDMYGRSDSISATDLENLMDIVRERSCSRVRRSNGISYGSTSQVSLPSNSCYVGQNLNIDCVLNSPLSARDIYRIYQLPTGGTIDWSAFKDLAVAVLFELQKNNDTVSSEVYSEMLRPSTAEVWGYGFLAVTIINICACFGAIFYPLRNVAFYTRFLMFMVALGIGTLCASAVLVLIPEAFGLMKEGSPFAHTYLRYAMMTMGGIYMFFLLERFLKFMQAWKKERKAKDPQITQIGYTNGGGDASKLPTVTAVVNGEAIVWEATSIPVETPAEEQKKHGHSHSEPGVKPVAWMVIFGDAIHNFVDGLSIGAAFSRRILFGVSVSLAIVCEELPHELGDFAILLNSGMTMKKALLCNLLSAASCYLGLILGILIGELEEGSQWIFAMAGGMFLYISLANMLPELNEEADREKESVGSCWPSFITHNAGLLTGVFIIFILARFGDTIDVESNLVSQV